MHYATRRRRRQLMTRRSTRHSPRRGFATAFVVLFASFGLLIGGSILGTVGGLFAAYAYFERGLPDPRILEKVPLAQSSYVYDRSGQTLLARFECENRESVKFKDVPKVIIDATVASEDRTFWQNPGIDIQGIGRAALANLEAGRVVQGASTITQQVIKYAGATEEQAQETEGCVQPAPEFLAGRSVEDKIREQIMALQVTQAYPGLDGKRRILETYLNLIYYGNQSYGIKAAAANYFGLTDLSKMTVAQAAFLAALPQQPSFLDPYQNPNGPADAIRERDLVLGRMLDERYITRAQYNEAIKTPMPLESFSRLQTPLLEPHFAFRARLEAIAILTEMGVPNPGNAVDTGGYRITTTLDYKLQQMAKAEVRKWVTALVDKNVHNGALVSINSETGEIVAYVGSVDYYNREDKRVQGQFDVAGLGRRQPGSAFKPITYTAAFKQRKASPATLLVDAWTEFGLGGPQSSYRPSNADVTDHGPVLAVDALRYSLNVPSVKMQHIAGVEQTAEFARSLGITEDLLAPDPGLTLTLGAVPISLLEMTQAYTVFAQQGELHPARTIREIRDRDNRIIYTLAENGPEVTQPLTPAEAYLTHWILEGNTDPRKNVLWGPRAELLDQGGVRRQAGFKTGTTDLFRDVSGFGYVPESLVTGVWMGNNNMEPLSNRLGQGLFSADGPLYLWHDFMEQALNGAWAWNGEKPVPQTAFQRPPDITEQSVCRFTGMRPGRCGRTQVMPFLSDFPPPVDNITPRGCIDLPLHEELNGRPQQWVEAARTWANRLASGNLGARGDPERENVRPDQVQFRIAPLYGERGWGPICGVRTQRVGGSRSSPSPAPSGSPAASPQATPAPSP